MKIYKKNDKIIIEIDFWSKRINPYMLDEDDEPEDVGEYKTLTGLITEDQFGNEEMGFALTIDMDYKGKSDQFTSIMINYWDGEKEDFIKLCRELDIEIFDIRNKLKKRSSNQ